MDSELFNDLSASIEEARKVRRGEVEPSRMFVYPEPDVKALREKAGLSQSQFANCLHVSRRTLENWEQKRRKLSGAAVALHFNLESADDLTAQPVKIYSKSKIKSLH